MDGSNASKPLFGIRNLEDGSIQVANCACDIIRSPAGSRRSRFIGPSCISFYVCDVPRCDVLRVGQGSSTDRTVQSRRYLGGMCPVTPVRVGLLLIHICPLYPIASRCLFINRRVHIIINPYLIQWERVKVDDDYWRWCSNGQQKLWLLAPERVLGSHRRGSCEPPLASILKWRIIREERNGPHR